ncbi:hypothetical protein BGZ76_007403, partial [Entomortierella beljakovae]
VPSGRASISTSVSADGVSDIAPHLKFVSRKMEIIQLMQNMDMWCKIAQNRRLFNEPRKKLKVAVVVGTAGKGKTTFARRAYERMDVLEGVTNQSLQVQIKDCSDMGRSLRISCLDFLQEEYMDYDSQYAFGRILLYEALKYRLQG